eukprot:1779665-Prymnesium_polylepis.2
MRHRSSADESSSRAPMYSKVLVKSVERSSSMSDRWSDGSFSVVSEVSDVIAETRARDVALMVAVARARKPEALAVVASSPSMAVRRSAAYSASKHAEPGRVAGEQRGREHDGDGDGRLLGADIVGLVRRLGEGGEGVGEAHEDEDDDGEPLEEVIDHSQDHHDEGSDRGRVEEDAQLAGEEKERRDRVKRVQVHRVRPVKKRRVRLIEDDHEEVHGGCDCGREVESVERCREVVGAHIRERHPMVEEASYRLVHGREPSRAVALGDERPRLPDEEDDKSDVGSGSEDVLEHRVVEHVHAVMTAEAPPDGLLERRVQGDEWQRDQVHRHEE